MTNHREELSGEGNGKFHTVQPGRDLESNWEVDLAKKLEEYLLKICSGEITGTEDDGQTSVNFAEAALLLQGSVQVYSRKVEYLYNLVLHALQFLSQKRQQDQSEGTSTLPDDSCSHVVSDEENDLFWGLDDIPVEAKNCLNGSNCKDISLNHFVKPPANLVVLEGDCLDTADGGELESYLLATSDLYRDFILLDPCDAVAVNDFLGGNEAGKCQNSAYRVGSSRKSFQSPTIRSGGTALKSSLRKNQDANHIQTPRVDCGFEANDCNIPDPKDCNMGAYSQDYDKFDNHNHDTYSEPGDLDTSDDDDDDDDPWKPLNPHEPGTLKVKPFRKVKAFGRNRVTSNWTSVTTLFPLARLHGTISPELTTIWETRRNAFEKQRASQSPPLFEKLRQSLTGGENGICDAFGIPEVNNEDNGYDDCGIPDIGHLDADMPEEMYMDEDVPFHHEKDNDRTAHFDTNEDFGHEGPASQRSLEDLCRSHLDALLSSITESEKQTELAARVSSWKQKIEHNLEEQDARPPFDIHDYGERVLDKLSVEGGNDKVLSFADVVRGQEKHDVARTFSALLQLVNNQDVDLNRSSLDGKSFCYTAANPFYVRLLNPDKRRGGTALRLSKKRVKSPLRKGYTKVDKVGRERSPTVNSPSGYESTTILSKPNCKFSIKKGKINGIRCTPDGKRRRRSRLAETVDLHS